MLCVGAFLVIGNQLTGGGMIAGTILLGRALAPVEQAISVWKQLVSARQAYQRLQLLYATSLRVESDIQLPVPEGKLDIENVIYRTNHSEKLILANISFQVKPGEMIAIIGPSGAGKSTLARLIMGVLKPTNGCIRLDGVDVYAWERTDFGRHVGYLPQDIELFSGTVKDNIARMGQVDDESVVAAAQLAQVHDMILRLPNAYETKIGNQSYILSGGMRQRIALARALYRSPKLLVLDEPNSNLDNEGELALSGALQSMKSNGTTQIVITHKPSLVRHVDTIIFVSEGKIRMAGPRDKVLAELNNISQQARRS